MSIETVHESDDNRISVEGISDTYITVNMELRSSRGITSILTLHLKYMDIYTVLQLCMNKIRYERINIGRRSWEWSGENARLCAMGVDVRNQDNEKMFAVMITVEPVYGNLEATMKSDEVYTNQFYPREIAAIGREIING